MVARDIGGDVVEVVLHREVASLQPMHLRIREIGQEGLSTRWRKEDVRLSPEDQSLRLVIPQEGLPLRIQSDVLAIVVEQIEVDPNRVRSLHKAEIGFPVVGADDLWLPGAEQIDALDRIVGEKVGEGFFGLGRLVLPQGAAKPIPGRGKTDLVGAWPCWGAAQAPSNGDCSVRRDVSRYATDNFAGGKLAGEYLKAHIPAGATVGQIAGVPGVPSLDDRLKGMAAGLGDGYKIVGGNVSTGCGAEKAVGAAEDILTANPNVVAFYGACQGPTEGAILALANANIDPKSVIVVGFDGADSELVAIKGGTEAATVMQFPSKIGEIGGETTYKAIKGENVPKFVDTGTALVTVDNLAQYMK
jgi:hypothetical protein